MSAYDDYPAVASPYEEEDDERQPQLDYPPPMPALSSSALPQFPAASPPMSTLMPPAQRRMSDLIAQGPPPVHPLHGFKKGLDILGQIFAPRVEQQLRYGPQIAYNSQRGQAEEDVKNENEGLDAPVERRQKEALAKQEEARAQATLRPQPEIGTTPEALTIHDLMAGENGQPRLNPQTNKPYSYLEAYQAVNQAKQDTRNTPEISLDKQYNDAIAKGDHETATRILKVKHDLAVASQAPQQPQGPQQQLIVGPDGTVMEARPGMKLPAGSKTISGDLAGNKPNADEQKRADMVENLNENLDQLEDIVTRRPDLFGPLAGRITKGKEWLGSDDPDVAALKGIEDRLGMVQQSAHSMRSAQHVAASADSILNGFKNGPEAMKRAISDARKSGQTFTQDAQRGQPPAAAQPGASAQQPVYATNPKTKERVVTTDGGKTWQPAK